MLFQIFRTPLGKRERTRSYAMLANALFFDESFEVDKKFVRKAKRHYLAEVQTMNFKSNADVSSSKSEFKLDELVKLITQV